MRLPTNRLAKLLFLLLALCSLGVPEREVITAEPVVESIVSPVDPKQIDCLADMVYGEARGESPYGQLLVALVAINRSMSDKYPHSVCAVVHQKNQFQLKRLRGYPTIRIATFALQYYSVLPFKDLIYFRSGPKGKFFGKYKFTIGHHHFYAKESKE